MQFRKLKRLAEKVGVDVEAPIYSFGEWELPYYAKDGFDFNGQFTGSTVFIEDYDFKLTKSEVVEVAWEQIKYDAEDITATN